MKEVSLVVLAALLTFIGGTPAVHAEYSMDKAAALSGSSADESLDALDEASEDLSEEAAETVDEEAAEADEASAMAHKATGY